MSQPYSLNLTIRGNEDGGLSGPELLKAASDVVRGWLTDRSDLVTVTPGGSWESDTEGGELIKIEDDVIDDIALFVLMWEHGDREDALFRWRTHVSLATEGSDVEAAVRVEVLDADGNALTDPNRSDYPLPDRPRIVPMLIEQFDCYFGTEPLTSRARHVSEREAAQFTWQTILHPERSLPVVVVSMQRAGRQENDPTPSPSRLAGRLAGLATVVVYEPEATWELGRMLGRRFACFNGATRIYWPHWSPDDDPYTHDLWLADVSLSESQTSQAIFDRCTEFVVQMPRYAGQRVIENASVRAREKRELDSFRGLVEDEVMRTHVKPLFARVDQLEREREDLHRQLDAAAQATKVADETREWNQQLESENQRLSNELRGRNADVTLLQQDKENLRTQLSVFLLGEGDDDGAADQRAEAIPADEGMGTIRDVVDDARSRFDHLRFLNRALESARASNYERPDELLRTFEVLEDLAVKRSRGSIGDDVAGWLRSRGIDFAPRESPTVMSRWGDQRRVTDDDGTVWEMEPHIKLGGGRGKHILRIHLDWDEQNSHWVIGHVGKHLTNTRS